VVVETSLNRFSDSFLLSPWVNKSLADVLGFDKWHHGDG
jgi:hypothetical protein